MKIRNTIATSILVVATAFAGAASANLSTGSIDVDVQSAVGTGHVSVLVIDGVATLFGAVESAVDFNAAEYAAASYEGVDRVQNHLSINN